MLAGLTTYLLFPETSGIPVEQTTHCVQGPLGLAPPVPRDSAGECMLSASLVQKRDLSSMPAILTCQDLMQQCWQGLFLPA